MFKLVVLSVFLALAAAAPAPGLLAAPVAYSAAVIGSVPTSVSHHSSSVVHSAALAAPVVHAAPVISAYSAPVVATHGAVLAAPALSYGLGLGHGVYGHGLHGSLVY